MTPEPGREVAVAELPGGGMIVAGSSQLAMSQPSFGLKNGVRIGARSFTQLKFVGVSNT